MLSSAAKTTTTFFCCLLFSLFCFCYYSSLGLCQSKICVSRQANRQNPETDRQTGNTNQSRNKLILWTTLLNHSLSVSLSVHPSAGSWRGGGLEMATHSLNEQQRIVMMRARRVWISDTHTYGRCSRSSSTLPQLLFVAAAAIVAACCRTLFISFSLNRIQNIKIVKSCCGRRRRRRRRRRPSIPSGEQRKRA